MIFELHELTILLGASVVVQVMELAHEFKNFQVFLLPFGFCVLQSEFSIFKLPPISYMVFALIKTTKKESLH